jgi:YbgC/YbaW family acyl-CoA thioester hydrolase
MLAEFKMTRRVQFVDTDMAGVMHFSNYLRWMEEIEHAWFRSLGMSVIQPHAVGTVSWPRITVSCEYFAPARFEDVLELHLELMTLSDKSMTYEVAFYKDGTKTARGRMKAVCCRTFDGGRFESIPIPADIREKMQNSPQ